MRRTNVPGHGLVGEGAGHAVNGCREGDCAKGAAYRNWGGIGGFGHGVCLCGAISPHLPSSTARKRWHAEHKDAVRAAT